MDTFRRLREQVSKQAVRKQFQGSSDSLITDREEFQHHQKLEKLYASTCSSKHFQRDIVRGVEGFIVIESKQVEIGHKLSEDTMKFGVDDTCISSNTLSKAALSYARARALIEKEDGNLLKVLGTQLKIHGSCPGELVDVIKQLEEATGSVAVDQIGRTVILYRPSLSKMKKRDAASSRKPKEYPMAFKMQKKAQAPRVPGEGRHQLRRS